MNLADQTNADGAEAPLLAELAREERARGALGTVLPWLVAGDDAAMLGEEAVVRTRALVGALAADLIRAVDENPPAELTARLAAVLATRPAVLGHCHALALEGRRTEALAAAGHDPVLSPLLDRWLGGERETAALAMTALAAQARFTSQQRRMELPCAELPADLMHEALIALADCAGAEGDSAAATLRDAYDEGRTRLALLARLAFGAGADDEAALLDPARAGYALFATALAQRAGVPRGEALLAGAGGQELRLVLLLRAAGASPAITGAALATIHPEAQVPSEWLELSGERAAALLAGAAA